MSEVEPDMGAEAELAPAALFDAAPDAMILVDAHGKIVLVNAQTEKMFGWSRDELCGRPIEDLLPARFRHAHEQHRGGYAVEPRPRAMGMGQDLRGVRRDGSELPVEIALSPIETSGGRFVAAAVRDITLRREIERGAKVAHERLLSALESVQDALAIFDSNGELLLCNSVFRHGLADSWKGPAIGASYTALLDAEIETLDLGGQSRETYRAARLAYRDSPSGALDLRTRDGRSLRLVERITPEGGRVRSVYDLTDDVRHQTELGEAKRAAEAANAAKTEFLRSMSHELRTPLNAVLGFTQLMKRDATLGERPRRLVDHVLKGGEHLLRLIDDVLDLARVESGAVPLSLEPVALKDVLEEARSTLQTMAHARRIAIDLEEHDERWMVRADRTRLAQIVLNFGSNAIKYGKAEGRAVLRVQRVGERLRISMVDDGPGIPEERQDRLFQAFYRAGQETGPIEGTGIGLALTRRLAEMMDGTVGFASREGEGSEFWVELPLARAPSTTAPSEIDAASTAKLDAAMQDATLLYVEDNPANLAFMEELMIDLPRVKLLTAPTGELGLELAIAAQPTMIILDVNLPGMSGFDLLEKLREHERTKNIPVIALSASAMQRDIRRAEEAGFTRYLTKPVAVDELIATLETHLVVR